MSQERMPLTDRMRGSGQALMALKVPDPLACLAVGRRVSRAGLDTDRQTHLLDRADQVALNVDGKRL